MTVTVPFGNILHRKGYASVTLPRRIAGRAGEKQRTGLGPVIDEAQISLLVAQELGRHRPRSVSRRPCVGLAPDKGDRSDRLRDKCPSTFRAWDYAPYFV